MADEAGAAMIAGRELPLPNAHGDVALASLFTMGVMLISQRWRPVRWAQSVVAENLMDEFSAGSVDGNKPISRRIWALLKHSRQTVAMRTAAQKAAPRGFTAGRVLAVALRLGVHIPRFASINNAVRIVMREQDRARSAVMADWGDFKPVAHLWAALPVFLDMSDEAIKRFISAELANLDAQDLPCVELERIAADVLNDFRTDELFQWWQDENFLVVLSIAEAFREAGECQKAVGAREVLLTIGTAFRCPQVLAIVPSTLSLPPPTDWMIQEIGGI
jgi:hypothetical protein